MARVSVPGGTLVGVILPDTPKDEPKSKPKGEPKSKPKGEQTE